VTSAISEIDVSYIVCNWYKLYCMQLMWVVCSWC